VTSVHRVRSCSIVDGWASKTNIVRSLPNCDIMICTCDGWCPRGSISLGFSPLVCASYCKVISTKMNLTVRIIYSLRSRAFWRSLTLFLSAIQYLVKLCTSKHIDEDQLCIPLSGGLLFGGLFLISSHDHVRAWQLSASWKLAATEEEVKENQSYMLVLGSL